MKQWGTAGTRPDREKLVVAQEIVQQLLGDDTLRRFALNIMHELIQHAAKPDPRSWSITLFSQRVRLNVGGVWSMDIGDGGIQVPCSIEAVPPELRGQTQLLRGISAQWLRDNFEHEMVVLQLESPTESHWAAVRSSTLHWVDTSADGRARFAQFHSPGFVRYLEKSLSVSLDDTWQCGQACSYRVGVTVKNNIFAFQANPDEWDPASQLDALGPGGVIEYRAKAHFKKMRRGDVVLFWSSKGSTGRPRACYGVGRLVGEPTTDGEGARSVQVAICNAFTEPLLETTLAEMECLAEMTILGGPQGTNFVVTHDEWYGLLARFPHIAVGLDNALPVGDVQIIEKRRDELEQLLREFADEYDVATHVAHAGETRAVGRANYERAVELGTESSPGVDFVLRGLLPHADSADNQTQNRWISIAPAINSQVQSWFESKGWVAPHQWQEVAEAIMKLIEQALSGELEKACNEFLKHPFKGLQAGFLSPILNAVAPDQFNIVNVKPVKTLAHFTGIQSDANLSAYRVVNDYLFQFAELCAHLVPDVVQQLGVSASEFTDTFAHWLVSERKHFKTSKKLRYRKISPGAGGGKWRECHDGNYISIGWNELGDVSGFSLTDFNEAVERVQQANPKWTKHRLSQVWEFSRLSVGDKVVANEGTSKVVGFGTVSGPYYFVPGPNNEDHHAHRLPVEWEDTKAREVNQGGWRRTLVKLDEDTWNSLLNAPALGDDAPDPDVGVGPIGDGEPSNATNLILYGPPGTGKTYATSERAVQLSLMPDDEMSREEITHEFRRLAGMGQIEFVTFHQSYGYEEFVEGIRPSTSVDESDVQYRFEAGVFKRIALRAAAAGVQLDPLLDTPGSELERLQLLIKEGRTDELNYDGVTQYVLVIDEINRGNMSKILGELITLLEPSKRLTKPDELVVQLPYTKELFAVPPNLHVIGTMNTADRSIALMDVALRRRFHFEALMPSVGVIVRLLNERVTDAVFGGKKAFINLVAAMFECINARIRFLYDEDHQIGHSVFLRATTFAELADVFSRQVIPLLQEYFYGSWDRVCSVLGCPYVDGRPARDHLTVDGRYRAPLVQAEGISEQDLLGFDHLDYEDGVEYRVSPGCDIGTSPERLKQMFEDVLTGPYLAGYNDAAYYP